MNNKLDSSPKAIGRMTACYGSLFFSLVRFHLFNLENYRRINKSFFFLNLAIKSVREHQKTNLGGFTSAHHVRWARANG